MIARQCKAHHAETQHEEKTQTLMHHFYWHSYNNKIKLTGIWPAAGVTPTQIRVRSKTKILFKKQKSKRAGRYGMNNRFFQVPPTGA
jgi:hypothetical protein